MMASKTHEKKQLTFAAEYLLDLNGKQAALRAGYAKSGAAQQASLLLTYPNVQAYIQEHHGERLKNVELTSDRIIEELGYSALFDVRELYDKEGKLIPIHLLPEHVARAIAGTDVETKILPGKKGSDELSLATTTTKIKMNDKTKSLELAGKHLKMFTDKVEHEHTGKDGAPLIPEEMSDLEAARRMAFIINKALMIKDKGGK